MHFFVKLTPHRADFATTMTEAEQHTMADHANYWREHLRQDRVLVFGPVFDPAGAWGMGVMQAESVEAAQAVVAQDPARELMRFDVYPMQAVAKP